MTLGNGITKLVSVLFVAMTNIIMILLVMIQIQLIVPSYIAACVVTC
jgi:hypothetical protein